MSAAPPEPVAKKLSRSETSGEAAWLAHWRARLVEFSGEPLFRQAFAALGLSTLLSAFAISRLALWPLEWVMLVPLFFVLWRMSPKGAFFFGWAAGFLAHLVLFRWLAGTAVRFGSFPPAAGIFTLILFALSHGLLWGLWLWAARRLERDRWPRPLAASLPYVAVAAWLPQLFPWWVGMTQHYLTWFAQVADLAGVALVSALVIGANAAITEIAGRRGRPRRPEFVTAGLIVLACVYGALRVPAIERQFEDVPGVKVALLQTNVPIEEKTNWAYAGQRYEQLLEMTGRAIANGSQIVAYPETALPFRYWGGAAERHNIDGSSFRRAIEFASRVQEMGVPIVATGVLNRREGVANSAFLLHPVEGKAPEQVAPGEIIGARYDKRILLAFGEYMPAEQLMLRLRSLGIPIQAPGFVEGSDAVSFEAAGLRLAASICYEAILPRLTRSALQGNEHAILNMTNDAWFGEGDERYQHWTLSVWRTIENRVWLLRVTNTGRTSVVDPVGREVDVAPLDREAILDAEIPPVRMSSLYRSMGPWFELLCAVVTLAGVGFSLRASRRSPPEESV